MRPDTCADPRCPVRCNGHCARVRPYCPVCGRCRDIRSLYDLGPLALTKKPKKDEERDKPKPHRVRAIGVCGHQLGASNSEKTGSCLAMTEANVRLVRLAQERQATG